VLDRELPAAKWRARVDVLRLLLDGRHR